MKTTFKNVNKALQEAGLDVRLCKGYGYFYFEGELMGVVSTSVYVNNLADLSVSTWVAEAQAMYDDAIASGINFKGK